MHALKPSLEKTPVIAVDVSSVRVGETSAGSIIALRGAVVSKQNGRRRYIRLGPIPLHVTEENKREIFSVLSHQRSENCFPRMASFAAFLNGRESFTMDPNLSLIQTRLTNLFEDWLQKNVATMTCDSIMLFDGSLTVKTGDQAGCEKEQTLETATKNRNTVFAFSKATRLRILGRLLMDINWKSSAPSLLEILDMPERIGAVRFLGNIYIARLKEKEYAYRLDVYKAISRQQTITSIQRLLGNDTLQYGYPETLRLAHIFSTFTANEVLGIQRYLTRHYGLKIVQRQNLRKILFGPYGTGMEE